MRNAEAAPDADEGPRPNVFVEPPPNPLPHHGLGSSRLQGHGLGAERLQGHGLGSGHTQGLDGHGGMTSQHASPRTQRQPDEGPAEPSLPPLVTPGALLPADALPAPVDGTPPAASEQFVAARLTRGQFIGLVGGLGVLAAGLGSAVVRSFTHKNQFEQLGQELGQGPVRSFKFVGDRRRELYWPNEPRYAEDIPETDRVYIRDDAALTEFPTYAVGQL